MMLWLLSQVSKRPGWPRLGWNQRSGTRAALMLPPSADHTCRVAGPEHESGPDLDT